MLVDTSIWIDYLKDNNFKAACDYLDDHLSNYRPIFFTPLIYHEVLRGIKKDSEYRKVKQNFESYRFYTLNNQKKAAEDSAMIYRTCRAKGLTIRKANDCMIALVALAFNLPILHKDKDFDNIAKVYPLKTIKVT
jgi:hypothetical protein